MLARPAGTNLRTPAILPCKLRSLRRQPIRGEFSSFFAYPGTDEASDELVFLAERSEDDWARLLAETEGLRFAPGDTIVRAGDRDRALYIVASGTLEVLLPGADGALRRSGTVGARSVFGEVAFVDGRPRSATIRALERGELRRLTFDAFEVLAARYPELGRAILLELGRILASRLRLAEEGLRRASR